MGKLEFMALDGRIKSGQDEEQSLMLARMREGGDPVITNVSDYPQMLRRTGFPLSRE
jgi:hypothetical protein